MHFENWHLKSQKQNDNWKPTLKTNKCFLKTEMTNIKNIMKIKQNENKKIKNKKKWKWKWKSKIKKWSELVWSITPRLEEDRNVNASPPPLRGPPPLPFSIIEPKRGVSRCPIMSWRRAWHGLVADRRLTMGHGMHLSKKVIPCHRSTASICVETRNHTSTPHYGARDWHGQSQFQY